MITATIAGVLTAILWGLSDYLAARSSRNTNRYMSNFTIQLASLCVVVPIIVVNGLSIGSPGSLARVLTVSLLFTLAYVCYITAFSKGHVGIAAPLANSYALVTLLVGLLFFGTGLSAVQLLSALVIIAGIATISSNKQELRLRFVLSQSAALALLTALFWGVGFALLEAVVDQYRWYDLLFLIGGGMVVFSGLLMVAHIRTLTDLKSLLVFRSNHALMAGIVLSAGSVAFFSGVEAVGSVVVLAVIASASPLVTTYAARMIDHERLHGYQYFGGALIVLGIMALNVFS